MILHYQLPRFSSKRQMIPHAPCKFCGTEIVDDSACKDCEKSYIDVGSKKMIQQHSYSWNSLQKEENELKEIGELIQAIVEEENTSVEDQRYLEGYNDGQEGIEPKDPEDELYWLGYLDGKGDKTSLTLPPVAEKAYSDDIKAFHKEVNDIFEKSPKHFCPNCNWQAASKRELDWHISVRNCSSNDGR